MKNKNTQVSIFPSLPPMSLLPFCGSGLPIFVISLLSKELHHFLQGKSPGNERFRLSEQVQSLASFFEGSFPRGPRSSPLVPACLPVTELRFLALLRCGSGVFCLWLLSRLF